LYEIKTAGSDFTGSWRHFTLPCCCPKTANLPFRTVALLSMTKLQFKGSWNEVKGKLKQKYGQLTDNDLAFSEGKEDELLGRLQQRLGKSKEAIQEEIERL
jgi:uncharacterized protein YjbJ (UPF0337 family)